jgi:hypothetical protein
MCFYRETKMVLTRKELLMLKMHLSLVQGWGF